MRLIDAEKLKQQITAVTVINGYDAAFANKLCKIIDSQPTAYDVDKVVEGLEEMVSFEESRAAECDERNKLVLLHIHEANAAACRWAIKFVKPGGIE